MAVTTKKRGSKRQYSDSDKAGVLVALDLNNNNLKKTARETGVPLSTIKSWRDGDNVTPEVAQLRILKGKELSEKIQAVCTQILEAIPGKIAEANISQCTTAYGTLFDKDQLLNNKPTNISENRTENAEQAIKRYMDEAKKAGAPCTREIAVRELAFMVPELVSEAIQ